MEINGHILIRNPWKPIFGRAICLAGLCPAKVQGSIWGCPAGRIRGHCQTYGHASLQRLLVSLGSWSRSQRGNRHSRTGEIHHWYWKAPVQECGLWLFPIYTDIIQISDRISQYNIWICSIWYIDYLNICSRREAGWKQVHIIMRWLRFQTTRRVQGAIRRDYSKGKLSSELCSIHLTANMIVTSRFV